MPTKNWCASSPQVSCSKSLSKSDSWKGTASAVFLIIFEATVLKRHDFTGCGKRRFPTDLYQGTTSVVPISNLFLMRRADFSPLGASFSDFFRSLFSRAAPTRQRYRLIERSSMDTNCPLRLTNCRFDYADPFRQTSWLD
jgi:hypothetical protein